MKTKINFSKTILPLLGISITIYLCFRINKLKDENSFQKDYISQLLSNQTVDTVYLSKPFKLNEKLQEYRFTQNPKLVTISSWDYESFISGLFSFMNTTETEDLPTSSITVERGILGEDTTQQHLEFHNKVTQLGNYQAAAGYFPISFFFGVDKLTTAHIQDTVIIQKHFNLDLYSYEYSYTGGNLNYKRLPVYKRVKPYTELSYRPFHKFWDLSAGLSFETSKFNYRLGLNLFYCPYFNDKVGKDIKLSITYKF